MSSSTNTYMLYFRLDEASSVNLSQAIQTIANEVLDSVHGSNSIDLPMQGNKLYLFWDCLGKTLIVHTYPDGLVTVDLQNYFTKKSNDKPENEDTSQFEVNRLIEEKITKILNPDEMHSLLVPIKRGGEVWPYVATSDRRLIQTDYEKLVYHKKSKYQNIDIIKSKTCGNCLLLDNDLMIADSDLIYTHTLIGINRGVDYTGKEVLILGGGDGGTLYELLKLGDSKPNFIWMAEIDEDVVSACKTHFRGVCFDALDSYEGPNHKILFEDCLETLKRFDAANKKIDFVINDLTEYPVSKEVTGYDYDYETCFKMMELSLKILNKNGRLFARGNCIGATDYFEEWEADIRKLGATFKRYEVFVPSYLEQFYVLYEIIPQ